TWLASMSTQQVRDFVEHYQKKRKKSWNKLVQQSSATPDGVLLVDKAAGMTSHDVVALVRRRLQIRKVGHCGTLDPIATGLLLLTLGRGTKIQDLLMAEDKEYSGTMMFGVTTSTQDKVGEIIEQREVPAFDEKNNRARAAVSARLPLLHRSDRATQSGFHRCLQQRFLCSNLRARHRRGTRLWRPSLFAPTGEIGAIRCRERGLGRSDQKWRTR